MQRDFHADIYGIFGYSGNLWFSRRYLWNSHAVPFAKTWRTNGGYNVRELEVSRVDPTKRARSILFESVGKVQDMQEYGSFNRPLHDPSSPQKHTKITERHICQSPDCICQGLHHSLMCHTERKTYVCERKSPAKRIAPIHSLVTKHALPRMPMA